MFRELVPGAVPRPSRNAPCSLRRAFFAAGMLLLVLLGLAGCGRMQAAATNTKDDYQVTFATDPAPPARGAGTVIITVKDKQGQAVDAGRVAIEANMSHAGMTPETAESTVGASGEYRLPLNWSMGGSWYVDVTITLRSGEVIKRRFPLDVQ